MKKLIAGMVLAVAALTAGCGNMDVMDYHWTFNRAYIKLRGEWTEVKVKSWHDYDGSDMVAVETEAQVFVTHSRNVVLVKDKYLPRGR